MECSTNQRIVCSSMGGGGNSCLSSPHSPVSIALYLSLIPSPFYIFLVFAQGQHLSSYRGQFLSMAPLQVTQQYCQPQVAFTNKYCHRDRCWKTVLPRCGCNLGSPREHLKLLPPRLHPITKEAERAGVGAKCSVVCQKSPGDSSTQPSLRAL